MAAGAESCEVKPIHCLIRTLAKNERRAKQEVRMGPSIRSKNEVPDWGPWTAERQKSGHMESAKLCCRSHLAAELKLQDSRGGGQQCATPKEFSSLRQSLVRVPPPWLLTKKKSVRRLRIRPEEVRQRNRRIVALRQPNPTHQQRPVPVTPLRRGNALKVVVRYLSSNNCQAAALHFQATKTLDSLPPPGISHSTDQRLSRSRSSGDGQIVDWLCLRRHAQ